jgi:hypothetical protein
MPVPSSSVASIWAVALGLPPQHRSNPTLFDSSDAVREAWTEVATHGEVGEKSWDQLTAGIAEMASMREMSGLPRERRLLLVDSALRLLAAAGRDGHDRGPFLAGYFTNLLSPGTLEHAEVLAPATGALPTAFLWYGLFAGVNSRGDGLPIGNPIARRIVRDLTNPDRVVDRPKCDIAFEELMMVGPGEGTMPFRSASSGRLDIDIMPGVTMAVRWPPNDASSDGEMRRVRELDMQRLLIEMEDASTRCRHLTERLRDMLGANAGNRPPATRRKHGDKAP